MRKYLAEFLGTGLMVFIGCGSGVVANALFSAMGMGLPVAFTTLLTACSFGLVFVAMYYAISNISGCHLNPVISICMLLYKKMSAVDCIGYIVAQCIGGIGGAGLLAFVIKGRTALGANGYGELSTFGISVGVAFVIEIVLTFIFVLTYFGATQKTEFKSVAGIAIGLSLTAVYLFGIPFTGTSVNPARSIGPALLQGGTALTQLWVFILAPIIGGLLAILVYMFMTTKPKEKVVEIEEPQEIALLDETLEEEDNACESTVDEDSNQEHKDEVINTEQ